MSNLRRAFLFPRFSGVVAVVLALVGALQVDAAEVLIDERFEFGPDVPGREDLSAGESFAAIGVQTGEAEWRGRLGNFADLMVFTGSGGITFAPNQPAPNWSAWAEFDSSRVGDKPLAAEIVFIPGTMWGRDEYALGVTGVWIGLCEPGNDGLLYAHQGFAHAAARVAFEDENRTARLILRVDDAGDFRISRGEAFSFDPTVPMVLSIRVNPTDGSVVATLSDHDTSESVSLGETFQTVPTFEKLQIDLTSLRSDSDEPPPVLQRVTLSVE